VWRKTRPLISWIDLACHTGASGHCALVSPTVFQYRGFRFFFFSREETRMHVHVYCASGEAKYWMTPKIKLAVNHGIVARDLKVIEREIIKHEDEIKEAWNQHFGSRG
jgi:hypothetical protein